MNTTNIILIVIFVIIFLSVIVIYNSLIAKKNKVKNSFSTIDVLLKKRFDLIPNLVSAVKTYMAHEKGLLTEVTKLREGLANDSTQDKERVFLENKLTEQIAKFNLTVENYPDLKANENVLQLQWSLNEMEEQLSAGRRAYNATVLELNNAIEMLPSSIIAGIIKFKKEEFFEIPDIEKKNISIKELF